MGQTRKPGAPPLRSVPCGWYWRAMQQKVAYGWRHADAIRICPVPHTSYRTDGIGFAVAFIRHSHAAGSGTVSIISKKTRVGARAAPPVARLNQGQVCITGIHGSGAAYRERLQIRVGDIRLQAAAGAPCSRRRIMIGAMQMPSGYVRCHIRRTVRMASVLLWHSSATAMQLGAVR